MPSSDVSGLQRVAIAPSQKHAAHIQLTPAQTHYLGRVLRLRAGDRFIVMNGQGDWWLSIWQGTAIAPISETLTATTELTLPLMLLVAMPKGNGMDEIIRQSTEIGVTEIVPVRSERTLLQPSRHKQERWHRIATEAAEQAERQLIPKIHAPQDWHTALSIGQTVAAAPPAEPEPAIAAWLCTARRGQLLGEALSAWRGGARPPLRMVVATGPEGGWTEAEIAAAIAHDFVPVSLGRRVLRATTAPIAATALVAHYLEQQDWKQQNWEQQNWEQQAAWANQQRHHPSET